MKNAFVFVLLFFVTTAGLAAEPPRALDERGAVNLAALARLTAYVRYFHPSDAAAMNGWDRFLVDAVRDVEGARDARELRERLHRNFVGIAPTVRLFETGSPVPALAPSLRRPADTSQLTVTYWLSTGYGPDSTEVGAIYRSYRSEVSFSRYSGRMPEDPVILDLGGGVSAVVPVALYKGESAIPAAPPRRRSTGLPRVAPDEPLSGDDRAVRLAAVITAWGGLWHFYPYFDAVDVDWEAVLEPTLESAALAPDAIAFGRTTLTELAVALKDGHAGVSGPHSFTQPAVAPILWTVVDDRLIVIRTAPEYAAVIRPGDEVLTIDGVPAMERFRAKQALVSAAREGWSRYIATDELSLGTRDTIMTLTVARDGGEPVTVTMPRRLGLSEHPDSMNEAGLPATKEVQPGVWYLDVNRLDRATFLGMLPSLSGAKGVIFDFRGYPTGAFAADVLPRLVRGAAQSAYFRIPVLAGPDFLRYAESRWAISPMETIAAKRAFIIDGRAISYAESCMGIIEAYQLGAIVGEPTAGTNGNVARFALPGGYSLRYTGMLVVKHDGTRHHGVGILPTIPASRTRAGIAAGRDELLEKAIEAVQ